MTAHTATHDPLSATFAALANPTRRAILAALANSDAPVTQLAEPFAMSLPAVSKHLKVLERARLIERSSHAQWRPCHLAPAPLRDVAEWLERYRRHWEARLDRLDDYLNELQHDAATGPRPRQRTSHPNHTPSDHPKEQHDERK